MIILPLFIGVSFQQISFFASEQTIVNFNGVINICIISATIFYMLTRRINPFNSFITKPFMLYLVAVLVSLIVSINQFLTIKSFVRITTAYCVYLMITQFLYNKEDIDNLFKIFLYVLFIPVIVGVYQIGIEDKFHFSRELRIHGTFKNGQSYSQYLAFLLPFVFAQWTSIKGLVKKKIVLFILFFMGSINLLFTSTRIGWGAFIISLIIFSILSGKIKYLLVISILLVILLIVFSSFFLRFFGGFLTTPASFYFSNYLSKDMNINYSPAVSSLHARVYIWKHMLNEVLNKSPLLGLGSGTWYNFFSKKLKIPIASHNDYIEVLFGTGFFGLLFYLIFRFKQVGLLVKFYKSTKKCLENKTVILPSLAVYISFMFVSITEVWQAYDGIYWTSWIILGISECYYKYYILKINSNGNI
ncbi:MAG: O-antigen ligase family protein [Promethearchaeota archaeon]